MRVRGLLLFSFLFLAFCSVSPLRAETYYLPGAAEADGANGAHFSSSVFLTNPGTSTVRVVFNFIPFANRPVAPAPVARDIAAGHTVKISQALETLFNLTSDVGTITARADRPLILFMTTSNVADPRGTFGLALRAATESDALTGGAIVAQVIWASQSANLSVGYRTNVGLVLIDPGSEVEIRVFDEQARLRGSLTVSSPQPVSFQTALSTFIGTTDLPVGRVEFVVRQGRAIAYTAVVDNVTSDGIAIQAQNTMITSTDVIFNGVARTPGLNGTQWATDVRVFNPNLFPITVYISTVGFPTAGNSIDRLIPARSLLAINDVIGSGGFNLGDGSTGALRITCNDPFLAAGRTSNSDPTGLRGSFSAYQSPVAYTSGLTAAGQTVTLTGIEQSAAFRTNLGFLAGPSGASATLTLRNSTGGVVATRTLILNGREWRQNGLINLFDRTTIPELSRVDIRVELGALDAYASKIDNGTGDPVVIPSLPLPPL